jgi:hypothetical protein
MSRFHEHKEGVSTAAQPYCSAAILYSSSGLLKLQEHLGEYFSKDLYMWL